MIRIVHSPGVNFTHAIAVFEQCSDVIEVLFQAEIILNNEGQGRPYISMSLAGVPGVQKRRRFRRRGDPKTTLRHRQHRCTSDCHASISFLVTENGPLVAGVAQISNIASKTSSRSVSIVITWPIPPRVCQSSFKLRDVATYSEMHAICEPSEWESIKNSGSMKQGGWERWRGDRECRQQRVR